MNIRITMIPTEERCCEALAAMGARGTQDEIVAHMDIARARYCVRANCVRTWIASMWEQGYRVEHVELVSEPRREQDRIRRAADFLKAQRDDDTDGNARWRYTADEIGADVWVDDRAMIDLGARLESVSAAREDGGEIYSRWCADTTHEEVSDD